jgi:hypothetical protein
VTGTSRIVPSRATSAGAAGVVPKPFDPELLETTIDALLV